MIPDPDYKRISEGLTSSMLVEFQRQHDSEQKADHASTSKQEEKSDVEMAEVEKKAEDGEQLGGNGGE